MNLENLLRIAGQVAGIGGLVVVMFLLIARAALKTLPRPDHTPATKYFRSIDKLILYTFVLSLVGLIIYAVLGLTNETLRIGSNLSEVKAANAEMSQNLNQMQRTNEALNERLKRTTDLELKMRSAAIEVMLAEVTFDFRNWAEVKPEERENTKRSSQVITSRRRIWRAFPDTEKFFATYSTDSPFPPNFSCDTHNMQPIPNEDKIQPGKPTQYRWILEYDISNLRNSPLRTPFDITTRIEAWNVLQNPKEAHEGTLIMFPTRTVSLTVLFPPQKRPTSVECVYYPLARGESPVPFERPKLTISPDQSRVNWVIDQPLLGYHYVIRWKW